VIKKEDEIEKKKFKKILKSKFKEEMELLKERITQFENNFETITKKK
jgi:hypothetical protein